MFSSCSFIFINVEDVAAEAVFLVAVALVVVVVVVVVFVVDNGADGNN